MTRIRATYLLESPHELAAAAEILAGEQSTGTFVAVPGESAEVKQRYRTRVVDVQPMGPVEAPSLPHSRAPRGATPTAWHRGRVTLEVPGELIGTDLTTLLACLTGNVYELAEVSGIRLVDLALPDAMVAAAPRPRHGVEGSRRLLGVTDRPVFATILRPSLGLPPRDVAAVVQALAAAGIDMVKDDELLIDPPYCRFSERVTAVQAALAGRAAYAYNITGPIDEMLRRADLVAAAGGTAVQVNLAHAGFTAVASLRRRTDLMIHGHRAGQPLYTRQPALGIDERVWQLLWRLAGVDHLIVCGPDNKYWETNAQASATIAACLAPIRDDSDRVLPAVAAGQGAAQIPVVYAAIRRPDWMHLVGGAVAEHPDGPVAGVRELHEAWEGTRG